tara:strand:+ start:1093 stop:2535 length:1443 start_codon:yes stop_codon:yes gene_type:complete
MDSFKHYQPPYLLIDGKKIPAQGRRTIPIVNPATGKPLAELPLATEDDLQTALQSSLAAFKKWRNVSPVERCAVVRKAAELIRSRAEQIATVMTLEQGKPLWESRMEIGWTADAFDWQAEQGRRAYGRVIESPLPGGDARVLRQPIGPVAAFSPWNLPALLPGRKMATAIAAGCSIIIKPAEETPLTALMIGEALVDAGLPEGVLAVVYGDPSMVSTTLIRSPIIRKVSFTGSSRVGQQLAGLAAEGIKPITLELGGHAPTILFDDANIDAAVGETAAFKYMNAGQLCIAPTRFYVHKRIYDEFISKMTAVAGQLKVGAGLEPDTAMGPLANARRIDAMDRLMGDSMARGAEVTTGGCKIDSDGFFFEPTVVSNVSEKCAIMNEEPFGPIVAAASFTDDDEVIERANRLSFGLGGYLYTKDLGRAQRMTRELELGMVGVNNCMISFSESPFGGVKESGYGSEGGTEGVDAHLVTKFVHQV